LRKGGDNTLRRLSPGRLKHRGMNDRPSKELASTDRQDSQPIEPVDSQPAQLKTGKLASCSTY
jgi:hypothetical protein